LDATTQTVDLGYDAATRPFITDPALLPRIVICKPPAVVLGIWAGEKPQLKHLPGQHDQSTHDPTKGVHKPSTAPSGYASGKAIALHDLDCVKEAPAELHGFYLLNATGDDAYLKSIQHQQGFDGLPTVASKEEVDAEVAAGTLDIYRGCGGTSSEVAAHIDALMNDPEFPHPGKGSFGNGMYFAYQSDDGSNGYALAAEYGADGKGVIRAVLRPGSKVISYNDAIRGSKEATKRIFAMSDEEYQRGLTVTNDVGRWAASQGYDAVNIDNPFSMIVLNRTALIIQREPAENPLLTTTKHLPGQHDQQTHDPYKGVGGAGSGQRHYVAGKVIPIDRLDFCKTTAQERHDMRDQFRINVMKSIQHQQGFDGLPQIVTRDELDQLIVDTGTMELYRGCGNTLEESGKYFDDLMNDPDYRHPGQGYMGDGLYFAGTNPGWPRYAFEVGWEYGPHFERDPNDGSGMVRAILKPGARTINFSEARQEQVKAIRKYNEGDAGYGVVSNVGTWATSQGYDAIIVPTLKWTGVILLNRTALVIQEERPTRPASTFKHLPGMQDQYSHDPYKGRHIIPPGHTGGVPAGEYGILNVGNSRTAMRTWIKKTTGLDWDVAKAAGYRVVWIKDDQGERCIVINTKEPIAEEVTKLPEALKHLPGRHDQYTHAGERRRAGAEAPAEVGTKPVAEGAIAIEGDPGTVAVAKPPAGQETAKPSEAKPVETAPDISKMDEATRLQQLSDPASDLNTAARKNWKNLLHNERMALLDPKAVDISIQRDLDKYRTEYKPAYELDDKPITDKSLKQVRQNAQKYIDSLSDALTPTTEDMLRSVTDDYMMAALNAGIEDGSLKHVTAQQADELMRSNIDKMVFQEIESRQRGLGDHGIRHVVGNIEYANEILDQVGKQYGDSRLMAIQTMVEHDMGYGAGVVVGSFEADPIHPQYSEKYARSQGYDKLFGDRTDDFFNMVATHSDPELDWEKDPVTSAVRMSDNLALFSKEKFPTLFFEVPGASNEMLRLQLANQAGMTDEVLPGVKERLRTLVDNSDLDHRIKSELTMAVDEIHPKSPKFFLGMTAGEIEGFEFDGKVMTVSIKSKPDREALNGLFEMGERQFNKFAEAYDQSGSPNDGLVLSEKGTGKKVARIVYDEVGGEAGRGVAKLYRTSVRPIINRTLRKLGPSPTPKAKDTAWKAMQSDLKSRLTKQELKLAKDYYDRDEFASFPITKAELEIIKGEIALKALIEAIKHLPGMHDQQAHDPTKGQHKLDDTGERVGALLPHASAGLTWAQKQKLFAKSELGKLYNTNAEVKDFVDRLSGYTQGFFDDIRESGAALLEGKDREWAFNKLLDGDMEWSAARNQHTIDMIKQLTGREVDPYEASLMANPDYALYSDEEEKQLANTLKQDRDNFPKPDYTDRQLRDYVTKSMGGLYAWESPLDGEEMEGVSTPATSLKEAFRISDAVAHLPPMDTPIYRGFLLNRGKDNEVLGKFPVGKEVILGPTSFTASMDKARGFAEGTTRGSLGKRDPVREHGWLVEVVTGAKGLDINVLSPYKQAEVLTVGRFRVKEVRSPRDYRYGYTPRPGEVLDPYGHIILEQIDVPVVEVPSWAQE